MTKQRRQRVCAWSSAMGVVVVMLLAIAWRAPLLERYWLWRFTEGSDGARDLAARRLGEMASVRALPVLLEYLEATYREPKTGRSGSSKPTVGPLCVQEDQCVGLQASVARIFLSRPRETILILRRSLETENQAFRLAVLRVLAEALVHRGASGAPWMDAGYGSLVSKVEYEGVCSSVLDELFAIFAGCLRDECPQVRRLAVETLARSGREGILRVASVGLKDGSAAIRMTALLELYSWGDDVPGLLPALIGCITDEDPRVRRLAVQSLNRHRDDNPGMVVQALGELLETETDPATQEEAVRTLVWTGRPGRSLVLRSLKDQRKRIRYCAAAMLAGVENCGEVVLDVLREMLASNLGGVTKEQVEYCLWAIDGLTSCRDNSSVVKERLREAATLSKDPEVRRAAAELLDGM